MKELDILNSRNLAIVGVSRNKSKFGRIIFDEFRKRGRNVFGINKNFSSEKNTDIYPELTSVKSHIDVVIFVTKLKETLTELKNAFSSGIKNFWFQQGSESKEAILFCENNKLNFVKGKCVLMYLEPVLRLCENSLSVTLSRSAGCFARSKGGILLILSYFDGSQYDKIYE